MLFTFTVPPAGPPQPAGPLQSLVGVNVGPLPPFVGGSQPLPPFPAGPNITTSPGMHGTGLSTCMGISFDLPDSPDSAGCARLPCGPVRGPYRSRTAQAQTLPPRSSRCLHMIWAVRRAPSTTPVLPTAAG